MTIQPLVLAAHVGLQRPARGMGRDRGRSPGREGIPILGCFPRVSRPCQGQDRGAGVGPGASPRWSPLPAPDPGGQPGDDAPASCQQNGSALAGCVKKPPQSRSSRDK